MRREREKSLTSTLITGAAIAPMGLIAVAAETAMTAESAAAGITFGGAGEAEVLFWELCEARVVVRRRGTDVDRAQIEDIIILR